MSFRTLRFGDRTISYDAGLNLVQNEELSTRQNKLISVDPTYDDDGIGTSDDETNSNTSNKNPDELAEVDHGDVAVDKCNITISCDTSDNLKSRRVIKPDLSAISRLLAFDEEEEDDCDNEEEASDDDDGSLKPKSKPSLNTGWHKTIARDLARLTSTNLSAPNSQDRREALSRRHSITICESRRQRKSSSASNSNSSSAYSSGGASPKISVTNGPMSIQPHMMISAQSSTASSLETDSTCAMSSITTEELNVNNIRLPSEPDNYVNSGNGGLKTLNLRLDEVAHIRAALTKAELEAIDTKLREEIERGKVCFLCMKTKFGLFSRGSNCEMCKQLVCSKCHSKMRIPLEHFSTTPVFALSPSAINEEFSKRMNNTSSMLSSSGKFQSMVTHSYGKDKKMSLPDGFGQLQSVGSAPNSPKISRCPARVEQPDALPTISGVIGFGSQAHGPVSLPASSGPVTRSQYATLPKKNRRASWMSPLDTEREKLEGLPLTVCNDCKDMVVQVIRVSRSARRMQNARSGFFSLTPDTIREQRS